MHLVKATLVTKDVEPGWQLMDDDVPLGKRYVLDLDRIKPGGIMNATLRRSKNLDLVMVVDPGPPGWMPLMAFKIDDS